MGFSKTELEILRELSEGKQRLKEIAKALKKSDKQIYRAAKKLAEKGLVERPKARIVPARSVVTSMLLQVLSEFPNIAGLLSGSGIGILTASLSPKTAAEIAAETGLRKSAVYSKLKQAAAISIVRKNKKRFEFNGELWKKLGELLIEYMKQGEMLDRRVPAHSRIYCSSGEGVLFSAKGGVDAAPTAFSAYEKYGIRLLLPVGYYYLPKKSLSKKEVFLHSLYVAEKEGTVRNITYVALFYVKFKKGLRDVRHPLLEKVKAVLEGKRIVGCPTLEELKEKAEIYDIKL